MMVQSIKNKVEGVKSVNAYSQLAQKLEELKQQELILSKLKVSFESYRNSRHPLAITIEDLPVMVLNKKD